ncbi:hypothetical protein N825_17895 [Skermanella stibiiresistens SB22]|uniref:Uncharacterized protein n=1 Tax=Skermanella stibiiresistens SB22 TaxID=1385369 RepID=W9GUK5_9PROT|nr:hypothetical protein [Skermanella stibiiresistens]EWY37484.1 hypothetical protein N825_17895 [Skermanella stibiiresistens SB22]
MTDKFSGIYAARLQLWLQRLEHSPKAAIAKESLAGLLTDDEIRHYEHCLSELRAEKRKLAGSGPDLAGDAAAYWKLASALLKRVRSATNKETIKQINRDAERLQERFDQLSAQEQARFCKPESIKALKLYGNVLEYELPLPVMERDFRPDLVNPVNTAQREIIVIAMARLEPSKEVAALPDWKTLIRLAGND